MQTGTEKLGVIEASYASAIIGVVDRPLFRRGGTTQPQGLISTAWASISRPPVNLSLERGRGLPFPGTRETWMAPFDSSESLFGCTHLVLLLETETVRNYRKRVRQCEAVGEHALAEQLRAILVQQQDHQMYRSLQKIQQRLDFQT